MEQIIELLSTKLPLELVYKILFQYGGLQSPVAKLMRTAMDEAICRPWDIYHVLSDRQSMRSIIWETLKYIDEGTVKPFYQGGWGKWGVAIRQCHLPFLPQGWDPSLTDDMKIDRINYCCQRLNITLSDKEWQTAARIISRCETDEQALELFNRRANPGHDNLSTLFDIGVFDYKPVMNWYLDHT